VVGVSLTPIFDALMDEFYPEVIDVDLPRWALSFVKASAWARGIPVEMHLQDIVTDRARAVVAEARRA
jgi:hypothetical protein